MAATPVSSSSSSSSSEAHGRNETPGSAIQEMQGRPEEMVPFIFDSPIQTPRKGNGTATPTVYTVPQFNPHFFDEVDDPKAEDDRNDEDGNNENKSEEALKRDREAIIKILNKSLPEGNSTQALASSASSPAPPRQLPTGSTSPPSTQQPGPENPAESLFPVGAAMSQRTGPAENQGALTDDARNKPRYADRRRSSEEESSSADTKPRSARQSASPPPLPATRRGAATSSSGNSNVKPKPDAFTPIDRPLHNRPSSGNGDAKVRKNGLHKSSDIDGSGPSTPHSATASPRDKRRSMRKPELMQEPVLRSRYMPDARKRDPGPIAPVTREQCEALLNLLETHADANLRASVLDAIAAMAVRLPERDRGAVLQRAWQQARLLQDAALLRWAGLVFEGHRGAESRTATKPEKVSGTAFKKASTRFNQIQAFLKTYIKGREWNRLADALRTTADDSYLQLASAAQILGQVNDLEDKAAEPALLALEQALGPERMVMAFFQSSACPGAEDWKRSAGHTAAAVLHGLLRGDTQSLKDFTASFESGSVSDALATQLGACARRIANAEPQRVTKDKGRAATASTATATTTTTTTTTATTTRTSTSGGIGMPHRDGVAVEDTHFDIILELLLLEAHRDATNTASLSDKAVCLLLSLLTLDRAAALRAIAEVSYDNAKTFLHGVCAEALSELACSALMQLPAADGAPLLHDIMANGDVRVALRYLEKLYLSDMPKKQLLELLEARDKGRRTALEAAIANERENNVAAYLDFMSGLDEFKSDQMQDLLEAKTGASEPALVNVIRGASQKEGNALRAYLESLFGQDAVGKRDVLSLLSAPDAEGNTPMRLAMMKNNGTAVSGMAKAILATDKLDGKEKTQLLCGLAPGGGDFQEKALNLYYQAVRKAFEQRFPHKNIPGEDGAQTSKGPIKAKNVQFGAIPSTVDERTKQKLRQQREDSQHAMLSKFSTNERKRLVAEGRRLYEQERAKALPVLHLALRQGQAAAASAFIEAVLAHASTSRDVDVVALLLAKDADGKPALFNAMGLDRDDTIAAYVRAVLASDLKPISQRALLRAEDAEGMTALHNAFTTGNLSAMTAYVDAVLASGSENGQDLLSCRGQNGKSARATALECRDNAMLHENPAVKPAVYEMLVERFDARIVASRLQDGVKRYLTETYNEPLSPKKKT